MKKTLILFALIGFLKLFFVSVNAQNDLQAKFDSIVPRRTNIGQIENIFGKTDSKTFIRRWQGKLRSDGAFKGFSYEYSQNCRYDAAADFITRNLYQIDYPENDLSVTIFDNPWLVLSVATKNAKLSVAGIKVGDSLETIEKTLGKGNWATSDATDLWTLEFEEKGARFYFKKDSNAPAYPLKPEAEAKVLKAEKFDNKTSFVGCSKDKASGNKYDSQKDSALKAER